MVGQARLGQGKVGQGRVYFSLETIFILRGKHTNTFFRARNDQTRLEQAMLFHITGHLLFWASRGGATNSPPHVLYMGVSCSHQRAHRTLNPYPINQSYRVICCATPCYIMLHPVTSCHVSSRHTTSHLVTPRLVTVSLDVITLSNLVQTPFKQRTGQSILS